MLAFVVQHRSNRSVFDTLARRMEKIKQEENAAAALYIVDNASDDKRPKIILILFLSCHIPGKRWHSSSFGYAFAARSMSCMSSWRDSKSWNL